VNINKNLPLKKLLLISVVRTFPLAYARKWSSLSSTLHRSHKEKEKGAVRPVIDAKAQHPCHVPELVALDAHHLTLHINIQKTVTIGTKPQSTTYHKTR
jgi:hypothetical protein